MPQAGDRITLAGIGRRHPSARRGHLGLGRQGHVGHGRLRRLRYRGVHPRGLGGQHRGGVVLFDTAEVYGGGESERIIGRLLAADPRAPAWSSPPSSCRARGRSTSEVVAARRARASCERLGIDSIDLYQIHGPISLRSHGALADALATAHAEGLVKAVGVSNYSVKETRAMDAALRQRGLRLATNQIEFSLLRADARPGGAARLLRRARRRPAGLLAHRAGPADRQVLGAATRHRGSATSRPTPWRRSTRSWPSCAASGRRTAGRTPSQVALAWIVAKGAVPIPGAKNRDQAEQNAGALGWRMTTRSWPASTPWPADGTGGLNSVLWQHG